MDDFSSQGILTGSSTLPFKIELPLLAMVRVAVGVKCLYRIANRSDRGSNLLALIVFCNEDWTLDFITKPPLPDVWVIFINQT